MVDDEQPLQTLIFDVLGTVVDEQGSMTADFASAIAAAGQPAGRASELARVWLQIFDSLLEPISAGIADWRPVNDLSRETLRRATAAVGIRLDPATFERLVRTGHSLRAWPDSSAAMRALSERYLLVALSNASMAQLASIARNNRLPWHCLVSDELVQAYKPDPAVYRLALDLLELDPDRTLMVAAHPWDLRAAAEHGMRTAYVARPGAARPTPEDGFDFQVADLAELAKVLP